MSTSEMLQTLFSLERETRQLHAELLKKDHRDLLLTLEKEVKACLSVSSDEVALRMVRCAALLEHIEGPKAVDNLIQILSLPSPEARFAAGEALECVAYTRFKEVADGAVRAARTLPVGSLALSELPYILAEVNEPGVTKILGEFLLHADPDAVASTIEALVDLGDASAIPLIRNLEKDMRRVQVDDEEDEVSIGELAQDAISVLAEEEELN